MGRVLNCTQCGQPLTLKSFNPWLSTFGGLGVIILSSLTLAVRQIPVIWIGGFLFGGSLIIKGFRQWLKILAVDAKDRKPKQKHDLPRDNTRSIVFTCGQCSTKIRVKKGKGVANVRCPTCNAQRSVKT